MLLKPVMDHAGSSRPLNPRPAAGLRLDLRLKCCQLREGSMHAEIDTCGCLLGIAMKDGGLLPMSTASCSADWPCCP